MIKKVLAVILVVVVLGALIPVGLGLLFDTIDPIESMNVTASPEAGGLLQTMWPIVIIIIIIGIAAGLIFFALKKFNVIK